jgi:hypothetical protein
VLVLRSIGAGKPNGGGTELVFSSFWVWVLPFLVVTGVRELVWVPARS